MAFPQPNAQRELANRKILEELQLKKQLLLKQGVQASTTTVASNISSIGSSTLPAPGTTVQSGTPSMDTHNLSSAQRAALHSAHTQSFGFFIAQDSSFGNLILPVLPRFDTK